MADTRAQRRKSIVNEDVKHHGQDAEGDDELPKCTPPHKILIVEAYISEFTISYPTLAYPIRTQSTLSSAASGVSEYLDRILGPQISMFATASSSNLISPQLSSAAALVSSPSSDMGIAQQQLQRASTAGQLGRATAYSNGGGRSNGGLGSGGGGGGGDGLSYLNNSSLSSVAAYYGIANDNFGGGSSSTYDSTSGSAYDSVSNAEAMGSDGTTGGVPFGGNSNALNDGSGTFSGPLTGRSNVLGSGNFWPSEDGQVVGHPVFRAHPTVSNSSPSTTPALVATADVPPHLSSSSSSTSTAAIRRSGSSTYSRTSMGDVVTWAKANLPWIVFACGFVFPPVWILGVVLPLCASRTAHVRPAGMACLCALAGTCVLIGVVALVVLAKA